VEETVHGLGVEDLARLVERVADPQHDLDPQAIAAAAQAALATGAIQAAKRSTVKKAKSKPARLPGACAEFSSRATSRSALARSRVATQPHDILLYQNLLPR
jgi:hypothetical protein